jgi:outer membrane protein OmpA-like peptidoglycan-associated protein
MSSAASDETPYLVFGPPAVGSNGVYTVNATFGVPFTLPGISSGSQVPSATYTVGGTNTAGCTVGSNGTGFSFSHVGTCTVSVVATGDPDDSSNGGNSDGHEGPGNDPDTASATLTVTVKPGVQTISVTPESGPVGTPLALTATGYLGTGAITFAVVSGGTAAGCALSGGSQVTATGVGTCLVTATIAADATYASATSAPTAMTFGRRTQTISVVTQAGLVGSALLMKATGYSGTGAITFAVVSGGTAKGCAIDASQHLTVTGPGTCHVTATIAADATYFAATSAPGTITMITPPAHGVLKVTASSETVAAGDPVNESSTVSGTAAGDTAHLTSVSYTYTGTGTTSYGPSSGVPQGAGTYSVTPSHATIVISPSADQSHYTQIQYTAGTLTITGAKLTVTANGGSVVAGKAFHPGATVSGLLTGDSASVTSATYTFTGTAGTTYGPSASAPSAAGAYLVTPSNAKVSVTPGAHQSYYPEPYKYVAGTLVITPAPIKVPVSAPASQTFTIKPFAEGSYALSKKLKAQVHRLAVKVKNGHFTSVELQAYTDNVFTAAFNTLLNQNRAEAVSRQLAKDLKALKDNGVTITIVTGISVILVSSNTTAKGRAANRRVVATLKAT